MIKDRRVRREPRDRKRVDLSFERAGGHQIAGDIVEPQALTLSSGGKREGTVPANRSLPPVATRLSPTTYRASLISLAPPGPRLIARMRRIDPLSELNRISLPV